MNKLKLCSARKQQALLCSQSSLRVVSSDFACCILPFLCVAEENLGWNCWCCSHLDRPGRQSSDLFFSQPCATKSQIYANALIFVVKVDIQRTPFRDKKLILSWKLTNRECWFDWMLFYLTRGTWIDIQFSCSFWNIWFQIAPVQGGIQDFIQEKDLQI